MAVPPLNTTIGPDVALAAGSEHFTIVHLVPDGSRKIRYVSSVNGNNWVGSNTKRSILARGLPAVTWADAAVVLITALHIGEYLPYPPADGIGIPSSLEPVNQIPHLAEWWPHVGRAAHGFDTIFHSRSMLSLDDASREVIRKTVQGLISEAKFRLTTFAAIDPILGSWSAGIPWVEIAIQAVCDDCSTATAVRQLGRNINIARFNAELANGKIYGADKTVKPWIPGTLVSYLNEEPPHSDQSLASFFLGHEAQYEQALDWYDNHIAHLEAPHGH